MTADDSIVTDPQRDSGRVTSVVPGQVLGERYRVDEQLGTGGMGVVCRGTHIGLGTPVAIKLIRSDLTADEEFVRRFLNEARRAALLRSERIARVHDVGQLATGEPFLVMELLEGVELGAYLEEHGALPTADAVNIAIQLTEGLEEAHRSGIVHRDIKPANTFLVRRTDGRFAVKILDFGISKQIADGVTTLTDARQSLGSPWYMSPEQMLDASHVDERSDLWSLGVVLFEMLSARRPFDGESVPEVCAKVLATPAASLSEFRPDLSPELEAIVSRCLEKDPADRFPNAASLRAALNDYLVRSSEPAEASVVPTVYLDGNAAEGSIVPVATTGTTLRRRRRLAHAVGIFGIAITLGLAALAFGRRAAVSAHHGAVRLRDGLTGNVTPPAPPPATVVQTAAPPSPPASPAPLEDPEPALQPSSTLQSMAPAAPAAPDSAAPVPSSAPDVAPITPASAALSSTADVAPVSAGPPPASTVPSTSTTSSPAAPTSAAPAPPRARPVERPLTPEEIQARKERYARWLEHEGLTPIE